MQETRLRRTETRLREGCQEFQSLSTVNEQFECQQDCSRVSLSLRGFSFQDRHSLAIGTSKEDNLRNEVFQDGAIVCHSISTLYMMSYISHSTSIMSQFLQPQEQKWNRPFTRPFFPVWQIMVWE